MAVIVISEVAITLRIDLASSTWVRRNEGKLI
jgi:hypothetical protein